MGRSLAGVTDVIMGRQLWQEWSQYWPANSDDGFGDFINPVRKHVLSTTLTGVLGWNSQPELPHQRDVNEHGDRSLQRDKIACRDLNCVLL